MARQYEIVVLDVHPHPFPSAEKMVEMGVPAKVAADWKRIRRDMTAGLKRRVKENVN